METKQILKHIGLTDIEATIYLSLIKLGEGKLGNILKESKISPSSAHQCLNNLIEKGLVSFILKNKIKYYYPSNPESLKNLIKKQKEDIIKREKEIERIIPQLEKVEKLSAIEQNAEIFVGFTGLRSAFKKLCTPFIKKEETYFIHKYDKGTIDIVHKFFKKLDVDAEYKHIISKGICSKEYKEYFEKRQSGVKVRYTDYPIPSNINIYDDKILLISWSEKPLAFLIQSKQIANIFKEFFNELWEKTNQGE